MIVSNAAERSKSKSIVTLPELVARKISLKTFSKADTVLWCFLKQSDAWSDDLLRFTRPAFSKQNKMVQTSHSCFLSHEQNFQLNNQISQGSWDPYNHVFKNIFWIANPIKIFFFFFFILFTELLFVYILIGTIKM